MTSTSKSNPGHFFEDFSVGMPLVHATPQTLTEGDIALYRALTGGRFVQYSSSEFAKAAGYPGLSIDPLHAFHVVFGKSLLGSMSFTKIGTAPPAHEEGSTRGP